MGKERSMEEPRILCILVSVVKAECKELQMFNAKGVGKKFEIYS